MINVESLVWIQTKSVVTRLRIQPSIVVRVISSVTIPNFRRHPEKTSIISHSTLSAAARGPAEVNSRGLIISNQVESRVSGVITDQY